MFVLRRHSVTASMPDQECVPSFRRRKKLIGTGTGMVYQSRRNANVIVMTILIFHTMAARSWTDTKFPSKEHHRPHQKTRTSDRSSEPVFEVASCRQRRQFLSSSTVLVSALLTSVTSPTPSHADDASGFLSLSQPDSVRLESGLLESRVQSNVLSPPPYGMEGTDIFYPSWFVGNWKVASTTKEVQAPLGVALFGGNITYQSAIQDVGNVLRYESRFVTGAGAALPDGGVVADRDYNVRSIARVAMGENSVVDVSTATPNKFSCLIAPKGAPSMISVDLLVLNRRQENVGRLQFDCSEVVREIATPVDRPKQRQPPPLLKEIETTSLYTYIPEKDEIHCRQRSAAFLLPSNQNEMAMKLWQLSRGQAIDIRFYDVVYSRR